MAKSARSRRSTDSRGTRKILTRNRPTPPALKYLVAVAAVLVLLYVFAQPMYVVPDSAAYLAYARSLLWDLDVDFDNDYARLGMVETGVGGSELAARTDTGRRGNPFGVGTALLWLPFIAVAALGVKLTALFGARVATDGFGMATLWAAHLATWSYLLASIAIVLRILREFFSEFQIADRGAALAGAFLGTPLLYYVIQMPSYSHACSVFVTALLLYLALRWRGEWTRSRAVVLGAVVGLEGLVRTQGIFFWIVPLVVHWSGGPREFVRTNGTLVALYTASAAVCFAPQLIVWTIIYGSPFHLPQGEGFLHVGWSRFLDVFFSTRHGFIVWSPIVVLAVAGWVTALRASATGGSTAARGAAIAFLLALGVQWFVNMLPNDWWAGWSFGARRFVDFVPFIAVGLVVFSRLGRAARVAVYGLTALNVLQWIRISTGGISGETDPGWNALWGGGFLRWLPGAPEALWTVLAASPAEVRVLRRPTALAPTFHSDPVVLFDVMFVVWALLVLVAAHKTHPWWGERRQTLAADADRRR
jgi:hypothetical protein